MKNKYLLTTIIIIIIIVLAFIMFTWTDTSWYAGGSKIGNIEHGITIKFDDNSTTSIGNSNQLFWMYYDDKIIDSMTYWVRGETTETGLIDMNSYIPSFNTPLGTYSLESTDKTITGDSFQFTWEINKWKLCNYSLGDGTYSITMNPSGYIYYNEMSTNLPEPIIFSLSLKDERQISLTFD